AIGIDVHERADGVERVKEEMGLELRVEGRELRVAREDLRRVACPLFRLARRFGAPAVRYARDREVEPCPHQEIPPAVGRIQREADAVGDRSLAEERESLRSGV